MKLIFNIIIFILLMPTTAFAAINLKVKAYPMANLIYQLNCVSKYSQNCSYQGYAKLWNNNFLYTAQDQAMLSAWHELMDKYGNQVWDEEINLAQKLSILSFQSQQQENYFAKLDIITIPEDKKKIKKIITYFYPKFITWWNKNAKLPSIAFSKKIVNIIQSAAIATKIKQFANLYEVDLPNNFTFSINLFYNYGSANSTLYGEKIENHTTMEFFPKLNPKDGVSIALHELCHWFFKSANNAKLHSSFTKLNSLEANAAYNLIDEVIATALNQGIINRINKDHASWETYLQKKQSFYYNNYYLDKAAKAVLPLLDVWLEQKKTIYSADFVSQYMQTLKAAFNDELLAPKIQLMQMVLYLNQKQDNAELRNYITKLFQVSRLYIPDNNDHIEMEKHKNLNALLIINPGKDLTKSFEKIKNLKLITQQQITIIKKEYQNKAKVIFACKHNPATILYIIAAKDRKTIYALLKTLASLKTGFDGIL